VAPASELENESVATFSAASKMKKKSSRYFPAKTRKLLGDWKSCTDTSFFESAEQIV